MEPLLSDGTDFWAEMIQKMKVVVLQGNLMPFV
jgi:hypothetical protein